MNWLTISNTEIECKVCGQSVPFSMSAISGFSAQHFNCAENAALRVIENSKSEDEIMAVFKLHILRAWDKPRRVKLGLWLLDNSEGDYVDKASIPFKEIDVVVDYCLKANVDDNEAGAVDTLLEWLERMREAE